MENKEGLYENVLRKLDEVLQTGSQKEETLTRICQLLSDEIDYFDWVGFYLVDPNKERELVLGPYVGAETDHNRIGFGQGICGQAAETEKTFVIQDVSKEDNYLACSLNVKSEIVVPVFKGGRLVGELDIDSHVLAPFDDNDQRYLEIIAERCAHLL